MNRFLRSLSLAAALAGVPVLMAGCSDDSNTPAAKTAEEALKVQPESEKTTQTTRKVDVITDIKTVDHDTKQVLDEKKDVKEVDLKEKTTVTRDVKVKVEDVTPQNK